MSRREWERRKKQRRRKVILVRTLAMLIVLLFGIGMGYGIYEIYRKAVREPVDPPEMMEDYLTENPYSRPGEKLEKVKNVFVHYTANPGTSAAQNRSYFENLKDTQETSASAHFIIGYDGEIIQCIPLEEIAYAVKGRNYDSVSIECCYLSEDGKFTDATYQSLIHLVNWLLYEYDLRPKDVLRHYDEGGKLCPLYYVEHEDAWKEFVSELK
ncbi:MAG: N-acetylmuramoyl-L-alanine amidase [Lachnospiraceae bacterium]|jgi:N-acetylmuramoyl-L-alanine amidase CwlA|uniref:peptidoglycan recognition protein family protein n=1 Tax=Candidatus Merdisoma sp. JLR.KK006 TaxID=3112626 RepID=UPI002FF3CB1C|nr:N-acetylmuramoyl-L-alanine amidase [Lachnospiraceae bacterium]